MSQHKHKDHKGHSRVSYLSVQATDLVASKPLPADFYLCINHRMVKYKSKGDDVDTPGLNKLLFNGVRYLFIDNAYYRDFLYWMRGNEKEEKSLPSSKVPPEAEPIAEAVEDQRRAAMDFFATARTEPQVRQAVEASKKVVSEFLKKPYAVNNISALARYSKGAVDHSVNVSTLSVFLGLRLGYSHQIILENLAMGGLFHDIGKLLVPKSGDKMLSEDDPEMQKHPILGKEHLVKMKEKISNEVLMIIAQHHEMLDGSGYPDALRGLAIYDLARLVNIANIYDHLVTDSKHESMRDRCQEALDNLEKNYDGKLDPRKLEKIVKILKYSLI